MTLSLAAIQMSMSDSRDDNVAKAERLVRQAASAGARIILIPELFENEYFCKEHDAVQHQRAMSIDENPTVSHFQKVAAELNVVLPLSVYERAGNALFNTVVMVDADGSCMGVYRKSHIPDGPGYSEKFYFSPVVTPDFACGLRSTEELVLAFVGINGFLRPPALWHCKVLSAFCIPQLLVVNRKSQRGTLRVTGSA